jgi:hypothetical protein
MKQEIELYFVLMMKDGNALYPTHGPFFWYHEAREVMEKDKEIATGSCYLGIGRVSIPIELL